MEKATESEAGVWRLHPPAPSTTCPPLALQWLQLSAPWEPQELIRQLRLSQSRARFRFGTSLPHCKLLWNMAV